MKRYAAESGTNWVLQLITPGHGHEIYTVRLTAVEIIAALFRKARTGSIAHDDALRAADHFRLDWGHRYGLLELTESVTQRGMSLAERLPLRGYDAVHLAAALELEHGRRVLGLRPLTFVSADDQQCRAAQIEGLIVDSPSIHPL